jgi:hypothetical protein
VLITVSNAKEDPLSSISSLILRSPQAAAILYHRTRKSPYKVLGMSSAPDNAIKPGRSSRLMVDHQTRWGSQNNALFLLRCWDAARRHRAISGSDWEGLTGGPRRQTTNAGTFEHQRLYRL